MNALPTNSRPLPTVPRSPVRLYFFYRLRTSCAYSDDSFLCTSSTHVQTPLFELDVALGPVYHEYHTRITPVL